MNTEKEVYLKNGQTVLLVDHFKGIYRAVIDDSFGIIQFIAIAKLVSSLHSIFS